MKPHWNEICALKYILYLRALASASSVSPSGEQGLALVFPGPDWSLFSAAALSRLELPITSSRSDKYWTPLPYAVLLFCKEKIGNQQSWT